MDGWLVLPALLGVGGFTAISLRFDPAEPLFFVGLTLIILADLTVVVLLVGRRRRSLEAEFEAGYRMGFRAGRRERASKGRRAEPKLRLVAVAGQRHGDPAQDPARNPAQNSRKHKQ